MKDDISIPTGFANELALESVASMDLDIVRGKILKLRFQPIFVSSHGSNQIPLFYQLPDKKMSHTSRSAKYCSNRFIHIYPSETPEMK
jgi:hypothetical protein